MSSDGCMRISSALLLLSLTVSLTATQNMHVPNTALAMMGPLKRVPVLVGNDAELPCDVLPTMANDHMLLVVWYRNDSPVYSYDKPILGPSAHWLEEAFVGRASWENALSVLHIRNVQPHDRDIYRCRVDFLLSPTKNYQIALDVIELPEKLVILDEFGKEINNVAGPYNEGSAFKLTCKVNGGVPSPSIKWLKGETILTSIPVGDLDTTTRGPRSLELSFTNATRGYHASKYTCLVENTKLALPQSVTVRIDLFLRPLTVEILSRELPLSVGRKAELWCKSTGARPPANITWWLNGNLLDSSTKYNDPDRSESQSLLQWMPLKEDNGQVLTCRAEHARFDKSTIEATLPLNIYYMPEATMHLGSKMNPNDIEEGDDVYFECEVDANPPAYKVLWEHNGMLLQHNPSQGIILSANTNLVLQNVTRRQAGDYSCTASNVEGDGRSPPVRMQILYRPFCKQREMTLIGAMLLEPTSIECEVDAFPSPDNFHWFLNNSIGSNEVDPEKFTIDTKEGKSVLTYTPRSEVDYGTLSCRASNTAGQQMAPCVYRLMAATRPDPLSNCTVYNLTDDALDLTCLPGFEGGLPNIYFVEAWENGELLVNSSNGIPVWNLRRLGVRQQLRLVVYAANARGRSEQAALTVEIATRLFPRTEAQESWEIAWALSGVLGVVVSVAMLLCMAVAATKLRHRSRDYEASMQSTKNQKFSLQKRSSPDDCNPDLIPLRKELPKSCGPDPPSYSAVVSKSESKNSSAQSLAWTPPPKLPSSPHLQSTQVQGSHRSVTRSTRPQREIVTTRTPLLLDPQESCV